MSKPNIFQLRIAQLEEENLSLREQVAKTLPLDLNSYKTEKLITDLAQNLVEKIQTGIVVHGADGKILFANSAASRILGLIQSQIAGKDVNDPHWHFYHGDGQPMPLEDFPVNKILREKQVLKNYEMGLYRPETQDFVWALINAYPEFEPTGEINRIVVTFVDISDLKQTTSALRESEQRYAAIATELEKTRNFLQNIIDHLPVAIFVKDGRDQHFGEILLWNRTSENLFGVTESEAIGNTLYEHFPKEQADFFYQKDREAFINGVPEDIDEEPFDSGILGGRILHTVKIPLYDSNDRPQYLLCFSEDITERKKAENSLRDSEERFRQMADNIHEIFWMADVDFTKFIYINPAYKRITGRTCESVYANPQSFLEGIHGEDRARAIAVMQQNRKTGWSIEYRIVQPNGEIKWLFERTVPIHNDLGEVTNIVGIGQDITDRKFSEDQLIYQAFHDSLTNLPNRLLFIDRLKMALKKTKRLPANLFAILCIDLDQFKVINDSLGHLIGDRLLIEVSKILTHSVRSFDTVARQGGDEFTILLDEIDNAQEAIDVSNRIQAHLQDEIEIDSHRIVISASIGIVIGSSDYEHANELLRDADIALYRAKEKGRACHEIFNRVMYDLAIRRLQLENELRQAIAHEDFVVYYEPIVGLKTMNIRGFEALVRWQHPTRGLVTAGEFIPICEETGMIIALGKWVLQSACRQVQLWKQQYPSLHLMMNVNLSGKQLISPHIIETIDEVLQETGIDTICLNLEITETILIENTEIAIKVFQALCDRHIQLSLDDFGTGFSSLSYLQRFPVNIIKIDRSFISKIHSGDRNIEIVKAIIALAHAMNIKVIAEGIEQREQITQLQAWDCDFGQGYFFARSLSAAAASNLLEKAAKGDAFNI